MGDFLDGPVVGVCLPVQWYGVHPGSGRVLCRRAARPVHHGYRSPWALEPVLHRKAHYREKPTHSKESSSCLPQLSLLTAMETQHSQKLK